jgi:hypothetical protein
MLSTSASCMRLRLSPLARGEGRPQGEAVPSAAARCFRLGLREAGKLGLEFFSGEDSELPQLA